MNTEQQVTRNIQEAEDQSVILAEYASLRSELGQFDQINTQIVAFAVPIAIGVGAYAYEQKSSIAFIASAMIMLALMLLINFGATGKYRISSYVNAIIEPKLKELKWERMVELNRGSEIFTAPQIAVLGSSFGVVAALILSWVYSPSSQNLDVYYAILVSISLIFVISTTVCFRNLSSKNYKRMKDRWKRLETTFSKS